MSSKNLWGDLSDLKVVRTPKTILLEQADYLTRNTNGMLVGNVENRHGMAGRFEYDLTVMVPALNNYTYPVLSASHDVDLYPVYLRADKPEVSDPCNDESQFENKVALILSSPELRSILSHLLSQVT